MSSPDMRIIASGLQFPEGPIAMDDGTLLVVEIAAGRLTRLEPDGTRHVVAQTGGGPNGAAVGPDGACYVCNNGGFAWERHGDQLVPTGPASDYKGGRIERIDLETGVTTTLHRRAGSMPLAAPNDLVFDEAGGLWFTDLGHLDHDTLQRGRVCYAPAGGGEVQAVVTPMLTPNGVALSPDAQTLYVAETITGRLWAFDVVAPGVLDLSGLAHGNLRPGRLLYATDCDCNFDSIAVEECGNICIATIGTAGRHAPSGAGITVVAPDGSLVERVYLPDRGTTNLCFGGSDHRTAYVTQSRVGQLLALDWPRAGLKLHGQRA
jgi:gluconolactonase